MKCRKCTNVMFRNNIITIIYILLFARSVTPTNPQQITICTRLQKSSEDIILLGSLNNELIIITKDLHAYKQPFSVLQSALGRVSLINPQPISTVFTDLKDLSEFYDYINVDLTDHVRGFTHSDIEGRYMTFMKRSGNSTTTDSYIQFTWDIENKLNIDSSVVEKFDSNERIALISDQESRTRIKVSVREKHIYIVIQEYESSPFWGPEQQFINSWKWEKELCLDSQKRLFTIDARKGAKKCMYPVEILETATTGYVRHDEVTIFTHSHYVSFPKDVLYQTYLKVPIITYPLSSYIACQSDSLTFMSILFILILTFIPICCVTFVLYQWVYGGFERLASRFSVTVKTVETVKSLKTKRLPTVMLEEEVIHTPS